MSVLVMPCLEDSTPQFSTLFSSFLILSGFSPRTFFSLSECDIVVVFVSGYQAVTYSPLFDPDSLQLLLLTAKKKKASTRAEVNIIVQQAVLCGPVNFL